MLNTTFRKLAEAGACASGYKKLARFLGGVKAYGEDTPIPLDKVLDSNGLDDALWTLRCTIGINPENFIIEFACRCAEHVLPTYEVFYPNDRRPRLAIESARKCIIDKSSAAWSAAWSAASAAESAARSATREWQAQQLREMLLEVKK